MSSEILKPCPFCGDNDVMVFASSINGETIDGYTVECGNCTAETGSALEAKAITAWNTRTESTLLGEAIELLRRVKPTDWHINHATFWTEYDALFAKLPKASEGV